MPRRNPDTLRPLAITPHFLTHPEGSALITCGETKVICTASVDETVPKWLSGRHRGWVTAEYDLLPRATSSRRNRDAQRGRPAGRTQEISRLIGRALRAAVDLTALGDRSISVDCDVIQADGGTRTAAITGGYVALAVAIRELQRSGAVPAAALREPVAAISVGIVDGQPYLDLDYVLDSNAAVDLNVVMTASGKLVEVQGTAEGPPFDRTQLDAMLDLALGSLPKLLDAQRRAIETPLGDQDTVVRP